MENLIKDILENSSEKYGSTLQYLAEGEPEKENVDNSKKNGDE